MNNSKEARCSQLSPLLCPYRCQATLALRAAFGISPGFLDLGLRGAADGAGGATATLTLVFSQPDRMWEQKHSIPGWTSREPKIWDFGESVCATSAHEGTEGLHLPHLLIPCFSHASWSRTTFSISPRCCSGICEMTLKAAMAKGRKGLTAGVNNRHHLQCASKKNERPEAKDLI